MRGFCKYSHSSIESLVEETQMQNAGDDIEYVSRRSAIARGGVTGVSLVKMR